MTITKEGYRNFELVKVYSEGDRFFGKALVRYEGFRTSSRITLEELKELTLTPNFQIVNP